MNMALHRSLNSAFLQLLKQLKQLHTLLSAREEQLAVHQKQQKVLVRLHAECEQAIEAMIAPQPSPRAEGNKEASAFKVLLQRSWALKNALEHKRLAVARCRQRLIKLEQRIEASLSLKAKVANTLTAGGKATALQVAMEVMLVKNQLWLAQYD
ncbi:hypothetical protein [Photobacterium satsumensis]|uniref:hypothetical protein n=1 Tax=Photobacterium satsumensis TaxID=2910239 RepID=UPI003D11BFDE